MPLARIFLLGFLADFLSRTVLVGFLTGVGCQVGIAMLKDMVGVTVASRYTLVQLWETLRQLPQANLPTLALSVLVAGGILLGKRVAPRWPLPLFAVVGTIVASAAFRFAQHGIAVIGPVPGGLPSIGLPDVTWSETLALLPVAASCFVMIISQSAATSRVFAERYHEDVDVNSDILGLSAANAAAAVSGTFVVNGSLGRRPGTADRGGGRSQVAQPGICRRFTAGSAGADRSVAASAALRAGRHRVHHRERNDQPRRICATSGAKAPANSIWLSLLRRLSSRSASNRVFC